MVSNRPSHTFAAHERKRGLQSLLFGAAASALLVVPAAAQEVRSSVLGEVIVTARKRQESVLNVPVITTVVGGAELERLQVTNLRGITSLVPGLLVGEQAATSGVQISLRGVGTTTIDPGVDQSVSLNIDGLQLSQGLALQSGMFDLSQLEVYKGPQSLFYGKSSPGGVISLRSADPTDKFELILRGAYEFEAHEQQEDYIISGPVTDGLKARLAIRHSDSEGYFRNLAVAYPNSGALTPDDDHFNATRRNLMRATVLWDPTAKLSGRLKLNYVRDRIKWANTNQLTNCPDGLRELSPGKPYRNPADTCTLDRNSYIVGMDPSAWPGIPFNGVPTLDQAQRYGTLEFNYRPTPDITVTSDTGYYSVRTETLISSTGASFFGTPIASQNDYHRQDITQELRVNSDYAGPFNFTAGGFYQDGDVLLQITQRSNLLSGFGLAPIRGAGTQEIQIASRSLFGQLRYDILPQLELAAGARWTNERRSDSPRNLLAGGAPVVLRTPAIQSKNLSPELTATYRPTDDLTVFGSWKKGYKSGSFNITVPANPNDELSYGDETVSGFEGGVKGRFLDRTLVVNLAGYDYKYSNLQVGALVQPSPGQINLISRTVNAASSKVYGVDFDATYLTPIEGLILRGALSWNHARYTTFNNAPCWGGQTQALGCNGNINTAGRAQTQDLSGQPLIRAPDWQGNIGISYDVPLSHGLSLVFENNTQFSSKYYTFLAQTPSAIQGSFAKVDLSLTLRGPEDRWEVSLAGRNLNNKLTTGNCGINNAEGGLLGLPASLAGQITGGSTSGPAGLGETSCYVDSPREVWLTLSWKPFAGR